MTADICKSIPDGSLTVCASEQDIIADTGQTEGETLEAHKSDRLSGHNQFLLDLARELDEYPRGTAFWNEIAGRFAGTLAARQAAGNQGKPCRLLNKGVLKRLKEFIVEHLDEPVDVATLAKMTNRSHFHFSRAFTQCVGMSPHRYVVHLRLQRAVALVRDGKFSLAEIALKTGFADQSHLTRWIRRVHGVSLTQIMSRP